MIISTYQQNSQLTFTSSKLTLETVEQEAKYVQSLEKKKERNQNGVNNCAFMSIGVVLVSFLLILDIFHTVY